MTQINATSEQVLHCTTTADLLAALPFLSGFHARRSVFLLLFRGNRGNEALRLDLPEADTPEARHDFLRLVTDLMRRAGAGRSGAAIVITCDEQFADSHGVPWNALAQALQRLFRRKNWPLRDLAVIAADGWAALLDRQPHARRSLEEISSSPVARKAASHAPQPVPFETLTELPQPNKTLAGQVASCLASIEPHRGENIVTNACNEVNGDTECDNARHFAAVIHNVQRANGWVSELLSVLNDHDDAFARHHQFASDTLTFDNPMLNYTVRELGLVQPDTAALTRGIRRFQEIAAHCPASHLPALHALLAVMWWLKGMQSLAQHHIEAAHREHSKLGTDHHGIEQLLYTVSKLNVSPPVWCLDSLEAGPLARA